MVVTIEEMAEHLRRLEAERRERAGARAQTIRSRLPAAKKLLTEKYGARRVVLFGSFARGTTTERSDVDLAVESLLPEGYFTAIADLTGLLDTPVDLVEIEKAPQSLRTRIEHEGVEL